MRKRRARAGPGAGRMSAEQKASAADAALESRRAVDPVLLDMRELTLITDYFVICQGTSSVHIRALADAVMEALEEQGVRPDGIEGYQEARWILLDYGDVIVHIFAEEARAFYDLERLWSDAPRMARPAGG